MVSDLGLFFFTYTCAPVLILVLMEYGLWPLQGSPVIGACSLCLNPCSNGIWSLTEEPASMFARDGVLILVLMEYGLWRRCCSPGTPTSQVLILVLMEYGLWRCLSNSHASALASLNPCSNGIWSLTYSSYRFEGFTDSLNPCSNGIWSLTDNYFSDESDWVS